MSMIHEIKEPETISPLAGPAGHEGEMLVDSSPGSSGSITNASRTSAIPTSS